MQKGILYVLRRQPNDDNNQIIISEKEWLELKKSKTIVSHIIKIEQKFDILIQNYEAFENELLRHSLDYLLRGNDFKKGSKNRLITIRNTINLLTSIGLFEEQVKRRHIKEIGDNDQQILYIREDFDTFSKNNDYKFIKELRNFVVHNDLPIDTITYSLNTDDIFKEGEKKGVHIIPSIKYDTLKSNKHFKNSALNNIETDNGRIDLRLHLRNVVNHLSKLVLGMREKSKSNLVASKENILQALKSFHKESYEKSKYCYVCKISQTDEESLFLTEDHLNWIEEFRGINSPTILSDKVYIHNRIRK